MSKFATAVGTVVVAWAVIFSLSLLMSFPAKWLINYVFSDAFRLAVFGVAKIGFWRAFSFSLLTGLLVKSSGK